MELWVIIYVIRLNKIRFMEHCGNFQQFLHSVAVRPIQLRRVQFKPYQLLRYELSWEKECIFALCIQHGSSLRRCCRWDSQKGRSATPANNYYYICTGSRPPARSSDDGSSPWKSDEGNLNLALFRRNYGAPCMTFYLSINFEFKTYNIKFINLL